MIRWTTTRRRPQACASAGLFRDIKALQPTKQARDGNALNKAGRISLHGRFGRRHVKIFQAASPGHARFIAACAKQLANPRLPAVRDIRGSFVIADWADGERVDQRKAGHLTGSMLAAIHGSPTDGLPEPGFSYFDDFLVPRFRMICEALNVTHRLSDVRNTAGYNASSRTLCHNDLTPRNIVETAAGPVLIDNEFLSFGDPQFDLLNAAAGLPPPLQTHVIDAYADARGGIALDSERCRAFWTMRYAGSLFVRGEIGRASDLIDRFPEAPLPIDSLLARYS